MSPATPDDMRHPPARPPVPAPEPEPGAGPAAPSTASPTPSPAPLPAPSPTSSGTPGLRLDLLAAVLAVLCFGVAAVVGGRIERADGSLFVSWPPLFASWNPHLGPGTPAAIAVAVAVIAYGPGLAARLPWRAVPWAAWGAAMAWTWSLALVDGWRRGVAGRLAARYEYLRAVGDFHDVPAALRDFTHHILLHSPHHWPAHVAGHPPAATLSFVWLDRIGLGGGGWAAVWVITVGTSAASAALVALRAVTGETIARRAAPFLVLAPTAIWAGVSADGYFTAVAAWSVALLARAAVRDRGRRAGTAGPSRATWKFAVEAVAAGLLFGLTCYLSYGLTLMALLVAAVLLLTRTLRPLPLLLAGAAVAPVAFGLAGFDWWEAYQLLRTRYVEGAGGVRPYGYWVWANLTCTVVLTGLATVAGLRRACAAAAGAVRRAAAPLPKGPGPASPPTTPVPHPAPAPATPPTARDASSGDRDRLTVLVLAALLAVLAADLSGMSKAETERIWQPFALWLLPAAVLLPRRTTRLWLTAQATAALLVNHLLSTGW